jgi:hypothetical protein
MMGANLRISRGIDELFVRQPDGGVAASPFDFRE